MSLRRSARNVGKEKAVTSAVTGALYQKADTNGFSKKPPTPPAREGAYPAPSPKPQKRLNARKKATAAADTKAVKEASAPKKAPTPRKRKAPSASETATLDPTVVLTDVANLSGILASTDAPPELTEQIPPEGLQNIDVAKPIETCTIPPGPLEAPTGPFTKPETGRLPPPNPAAAADEPSTPVPAKRQRRGKADTASAAKPVPFTPTPSGVGLIAGSDDARKPKNGDHVLDDLASLNRPADPHVANAPVLTPDGKCVVANASPAKKRKANDLPPDVGSPLKAGTSTVDMLLKDAEAYLIKVDAQVTGKGRLEKQIRTHHCKMFNPEGLREVVDPFTALASGIIGQQVRYVGHDHHEPPSSSSSIGHSTSRKLGRELELH